MKYFSEHYYRPTRIMLTALGLWPYNDSAFTCIQKIFFPSVFAFSIGLQVGKIITSVNDLDSLFGILWFAVPCLVFSLKYATFCIQSKEIRKLMELMKHDLNTIKRKEEVEILKEYANIGHIITVSMITIYYIAAFGFLMMEVLPKILDIVVPLNESRPVHLLGVATLFFDQEKYFFPILGHMTVALLSEVTTILATETAGLLLIQHLCALFKVASFRMQRIFDCDFHITISQKNRIYHANIVDATIMYNKAVEFFSFFNSSLEASYFILYWLGVCSLSINMFRLFQAGLKKETQQSYTSGIFVICHFIYIFICHWILQIMTNHSNDLYCKACNLSWYSVPLEFQKMLQLVIQRTAKPCKFALYMLDVSLERFASLLNLSLSYCTIFWSLQY
ncbi:hypothetical protein DMN91_010167 [Ooceraea biroi]|uniref:Odorant receptor n=1 Tax=Ooceraea biroi TaxID=2015173 RepID=A0A3L8DDE2_OOCBI|nr:hypothetical protein DMN91_010167 [Ooceraea biroi]